MSRRGGIGWSMVAGCVYKTECGQETLGGGRKLKWPCLSVGGVTDVPAGTAQRLYTCSNIP